MNEEVYLVDSGCDYKMAVGEVLYIFLDHVSDEHFLAKWSQYILIFQITLDLGLQVRSLGYSLLVLHFGFQCD
jgi:hypothetical protein